MKSAKKASVIGITVSVIASILLTTASAEELNNNGAALAATPAVKKTSVVQTSQQPPEASVKADGSSAANITVMSPAKDISTIDTYTASEAAPVIISDLKSSLISSVSLPDILQTAGRAIADYTEQYNGTRYLYGSASPKRGFDCSGLVYYVYNQFGYSLPRTARAQYKNGTSVEKTELLPGDLVFFATNGGRTISHVGIYIGDNMFIHAATSHQGVIISDLGSTYWAKVLVGARRIITPQAAMEYVYQSPAVNPV